MKFISVVRPLSYIECELFVNALCKFNINRAYAAGGVEVSSKELAAFTLEVSQEAVAAKQAKMLAELSYDKFYRPEIMDIILSEEFGALEVFEKHWSELNAKLICETTRYNYDKWINTWQSIWKSIESMYNDKKEEWREKSGYFFSKINPSIRIYSEGTLVYLNRLPAKKGRRRNEGTPRGNSKRNRRTEQTGEYGDNN